ncbi:hypothetical protein [Denitromonas halophila]|uniref:Uncharacterized protein n=1 Tax=Denitromonas halophila TaxID=1629404 RepID=A0A557QSK7_9RHOO|nr:hypothetical protein [Denitromonas halophila]TVO55911.1 hypothetical protein FHP91_11910 [Denitromonas halophila]
MLLSEIEATLPPFQHRQIHAAANHLPQKKQTTLEHHPYRASGLVHHHKAARWQRKIGFVRQMAAFGFEVQLNVGLAEKVVTGRSWPGAEIGFTKTNGRYRCVAVVGSESRYFSFGSNPAFRPSEAY